jgi:hypothetical protein
MGKFPNSELHKMFSNWHWKKCKRDAFLCDIDRLWVEMRDGTPKAVFDLKWGSDTLSGIGRQLATWFEAMNVPFYIVEIQESFDSFKVYRFKTDSLIQFNEAQMINWINSDLPMIQ